MDIGRGEAAAAGGFPGGPAAPTCRATHRTGAISYTASSFVCSVFYLQRRPLSTSNMHVRRGPDFVEVTAPAKLNLFLEILGKRPDGFHEIETVMVPVSVCDTLVVRADPQSPSPGRIELECESIADPTRKAFGAKPLPAEKHVPAGADNIVVRALEALRRRAGVERGIHVRLIKRIPVAAGMAGGSTDAAAALAGGNLAWNLNLPMTALAEIAAELGSDIPFFFAGGAALCRGRGERIEPLAAGGVLHLVVVAPPVGLSTAAVYRACRPAERPQCSARLVEAVRRGDSVDTARRLHNRLQPAAESLSDWIERLKAEFTRSDCLGSQMSGSGTSYFGVCRDARHARRTAARLASRGLGRTMALRSLGLRDLGPAGLVPQTCAKNE
jgi:4-diphosphocytidyl-2-C-methyl-D-erythritol kinase